MATLITKFEKAVRAHEMRGSLQNFEEKIQVDVEYQGAKMALLTYIKSLEERIKNELPK